MKWLIELWVILVLNLQIWYEFKDFMLFIWKDVTIMVHIKTKIFQNLLTFIMMRHFLMLFKIVKSIKRLQLQLFNVNNIVDFLIQ